MRDPPGAASGKKADPPSLSSLTSQEQGFKNPSTMHADTLTGLNCRSLGLQAAIDATAFMSAMVWSCPEVTIKQQGSLILGSYNLSVFLLKMSPEPFGEGLGWMSHLGMEEHSPCTLTSCLLSNCYLLPRSFCEKD